MGKVEDYIKKELEIKGGLLFSLIDPLDYKSKEDAVSVGLACSEYGADLILVGGSIGAQGEILDYVVKNIKDKSSVPVVIFPGNISTVSKYADAIYFMSLLNSQNPYWISQAQMLAAPVVKSINIETLPVGYIVVEPGGTVGFVGQANLIPRDKPQIASAYAQAAELLGMHFVLTDCGSNPKEGPIPTKMVSAVAKSISIPYIVGGGIKTPKEAEEIILAGADAIQVGTAFEQEKDVKQKVSSLANAVHQAGKKKV